MPLASRFKIGLFTDRFGVRRLVSSTDAVVKIRRPTPIVLASGKIALVVLIRLKDAEGAFVRAIVI